MHNFRAPAHGPGAYKVEYHSNARKLLSIFTSDKYSTRIVASVMYTRFAVSEKLFVEFKKITRWFRGDSGG